MKLILVCGTRPNFMKIAPLFRAIAKHNKLNEPKELNKLNKRLITPILVHTGQHYDYEMSQVFFQDLALPEPDIYLGVGSGTHAEQTGKVMIELEKVLLSEKPDLVVVVGDVNSTLAAALAAVKVHIPVAHVEAGLRHFRKSIPEEVNRLLTDGISDYLFTYSGDADENLVNEGIPREKIFLVGNVMVDSLLYNKEQASRREAYLQTGFEKGSYSVLTLHRPGNVDDEKSLKMILSAIKEVSEHVPIVFPCHPRTSKMIKQFGLLPYLEFQENHPQESDRNRNHLLLLAPLGYLDFINLIMNSRFVITDSGGIQEETTVLNIPCLTMRSFTARPVTVKEGTNILVGNDSSKLQTEVSNILSGNGKMGKVPRLWDGKASERIIDVLATTRN